METTRNSRWNDEPKLAGGKPTQLAFRDSDLQICKLLAPTARQPWGYQYLPTRYFAPLLRNRGSVHIARRLDELHRRPYRYIRRPEQPRNNSRQIIYALGERGADELREEGFDIPRLRSKALAHELMACLCAASFEIGTIEHPEVQMERANLRLHSITPDWPPFKVIGPHHSPLVLLEADTGSETLHGDPDNTTIAGKFDHYLSLLTDKTMRKTMIHFITTRLTRMESMIEVLKNVIDKKQVDHNYAEHFAFTHITYDRYINCIPKPTGWAITQDWQRAGFAPFNFLKP